MTSGRLTAIRRYPVKAMAGEDLASAVVEPWGIQGDRRWMVVDEAGVFRTARDFPKLLSLTPPIRRSSAAEGGVSRPELRTVRVWGSEVEATLAEAALNDWISAELGVPSSLVYLDDPTRRPVSLNHGREGDRVSFADGYPLLLTNEASLAALNGWIAEGPHAAEQPLPMIRFRPNVVVDGFGAWAEDTWSRVRIGDVSFRVAKPCDRCVVTTTDPETGVRGKEPLATLARFRNFDRGLMFGVNLIPDLPEGPTEIALSDAVTVIETREEIPVG